MRFVIFVIIIFISAVIDTFCWATTETVMIEGRVFSSYGPLQGARVNIFDSYKDLEVGKKRYISDPTDLNGVYRLQVSPGPYFLTAHGQIGGKEYVAFHMNNPISVEETPQWLTFMTQEKRLPQYREGDMAVRGMVTFKNKPLPGAYVTAYKTSAHAFKGLGFKTREADRNGSFAMSLPEGKYVLVAKYIQNSKDLRPLQEGDLIGYFPANPVSIEPEKDLVIEIPCFPKADRGAFVGTPPMKEKKPSNEPPGSITGLLRHDTRGKPPGGIVAFFDADTGLPPGSGPGKRIPDMKTKLHPDGSFLATLAPGRYYIGFILGRDLEKPGPPTSDEHSFSAHGPDGNPQIFTVERSKIKQVGALSGKKADLDKLSEPVQFIVQGRVIGPDNKPVKDAKVIALQAGDKQLRPLYIGLGTDEHGKYTLKLDANKKYYLNARSGAGGGQPQPGDYIGKYGGETLRPLSGKAGEVIAGIDIKVFEIPTPGKSGQKRLNKAVPEP